MARGMASFLRLVAVALAAGAAGFGAARRAGGAAASGEGLSPGIGASIAVRAAVDELGCVDVAAAASLARAVRGPAVLLSPAPASAATRSLAGAAPLHFRDFAALHVLHGTPMIATARSGSLWRVAAGPLFPQQLELAAQLASVWTSGGTAAQAGTLWRHGLDLNALTGRCQAGWELAVPHRLGAPKRTPHPAVLIASKPRSKAVWAIMEHMAAALHACMMNEGLCMETAGDLLANWWTEAGCASASANQLCNSICMLDAPVAVGDVCRNSSAPVDPPSAGVSTVDCRRISLFGAIQPGSQLADILRTHTGDLRSGTPPADDVPAFRSCRVLPGWMGGRARVWAVLAYRTSNLGDEVQSLTAAAFLPRVDAFAERDNHEVLPHPALLAPITNATEINFVGNAFWKPRQYVDARSGKLVHLCHDENGKRIPCTGPEVVPWPLPPNWRPFWIAAHLSNTIPTEPLVSSFRGSHSVPTRDRTSAERLSSAGLDAFHSYCLTLSLRRPHLHRAFPAPIVAANTSFRHDTAGIASLIPTHLHPLVVWVAQDLPGRTFGGFTKPWQYFPAAEARLALLASARAVVTSRLHVLLPSIALGVPAIYYQLPSQAGDPRLAGFLDDPEDLPVAWEPAKLAGFDWEDPPRTGRALRTRAAGVLTGLLAQHPELARAAGMMGTVPDAGGLRATD